MLILNFFISKTKKTYIFANLALLNTYIFANYCKIC